MTINEWASSTEAYLLMATVIWFMGSLFYSILVIFTFFGRLTVGIIKKEMDVKWMKSTVNMTILWTIFFVLNFFLHKG